MYKLTYFLLTVTILFVSSCKQEKHAGNNADVITIISLAPGHFHSALVQKKMYPSIGKEFYVYAPDGPELDDFLSRLEAYNSRNEDPTSWEANIYKQDDFFEKMIEEKAGNLVVLAGNNRNKTEYILECIKRGLNVLADKPMAIDSSDFMLLEEAFKIAGEKGLMLYDIMTERYEITTILQKALSQEKAVFGELLEGSQEKPAITKESEHHFNKIISGIPLQRPPWFFDVEQEGQAIADVGTHLVDLIQWEAFPGVIIDYKKDVEILRSENWTTNLSKEQFTAVTGIETYPPYLRKYVESDSLKVISNSSVDYTLKGVHAHVSVEWKYKAPEGAGDTHFSIMRGTLSELIIRQGEKEAYKPALYINAAEDTDKKELETKIRKFINSQEEIYPGLVLEEIDPGYWRLNIPDKYRIGHEAHFSQVSSKFLDYFENGGMPEWEVPNMLAKYYTTTAATSHK